MQNQLIDFRREFLSRILDLTWRQWTTAGIAGQGQSWTGSVIDPEALLLFSCSVGRYDARLFDAIQEWLGVNGNFVNVQRLKRILKEERFAGETVLAAITAATTDSVNQAKWSQIVKELRSPKSETDTQHLFYLESGEPLPVVREHDPKFAEYGFIRDRFEARGVAEPFRPEQPGNLLLRLRALLGVNARSEVFEYLLVNTVGSPRAIAADCYFFPATISKTMVEMKLSGFLASRTQGRRKLYTLSPDTWRDLFFDPVTNLTWVVWPRLFSALEQIWVFLDSRDLSSRSPVEQASSLRRLLTKSVISQMERSLPGFTFGNLAQHPAEKLIPYFTTRLTTVFQSLE
jgi:hypothetical protein